MCQRLKKRVAATHLEVVSSLLLKENFDSAEQKVLLIRREKQIDAPFASKELSEL